MNYKVLITKEHSDGDLMYSRDVITVKYAVIITKENNHGNVMSFHVRVTSLFDMAGLLITIAASFSL